MSRPSHRACVAFARHLRQNLPFLRLRPSLFAMTDAQMDHIGGRLHQHWNARVERPTRERAPGSEPAAAFRSLSDMVHNFAEASDRDEG